MRPPKIVGQELLLAVCANNFDKRNNNEDGIEDALNQENEVLSHADISATCATRIIKQKSHYYDHGCPPSCEVPPCVKNLVTHFVGDK